MIARPLWSRALWYGRIVAHLPFVRMVAVTGALAMDNVEPGADIDYLIVTEPGRLWLCRAFVIAVVRLAARQAVTICPNYFLSERSLYLPEQSLFTAHELMQMIPIAGFPTYHRILRMNSWTRHLLPNAVDPPRTVPERKIAGDMLRRCAEAGLRTPVGGWLERWEMTRKVKKLSRSPDRPAETLFTRDLCKGHFEAHGQRILTAFADRMRKLEQEAG